MAGVKQRQAVIQLQEAVVAAINGKSEAEVSQIRSNQTLQALTAAALALPGLMLSPVHAANEEASLQYGHYQEGERNLYGVNSKFSPIEVEMLHGTASIPLSDRLKFGFNYTQDTWSGATPISTAPFDLRGNRSSSPDGISGASPYINGQLFLDSQLRPLKSDGFGNPGNQIDNQLVHTLSSASPETRKQGDFKLSYEWDEAAADLGGGVSEERDYYSRFVNAGARWDFNQKLTTLNTGISYTSSDTHAIIDPDASPYIDTRQFADQITNSGGDKILTGSRQDWSFNLGASHVINKSAFIEGGVNFTHSDGFQENPYKVVEVAFIDPDQQFFAPAGGYYARVRALSEQRPDQRNQLAWNLNYVQHVAPLDAAWHFNYRFFHDDWGIQAHTFETDWRQPLGSGWTLTPRVRYYSQDAADFYVPYLVSKQPFSGPQFDPAKLPANYSSDHRLSGYGAVSGGVSLSKQFVKGVTLEAGFEYYTHQGGLKLGGGGEGDYANFDYWVANGSLKVNLAALGSSHSEHNHHGHTGHQGHVTPAGVMFGHMMDKPGDVMIGYRYMWNRRAGDMLNGSQVVDQQAIVNNACVGSEGCRTYPREMVMHMHMLDIMYAPTDWLNLMLMPQFMDMDMYLSPLAGAPPTPPGVHEHQGGSGHTTGGVGDTSMYALIKLYKQPNHQLHLGLGISAPTGSVDEQFRPAFQVPASYMHYDMQLGSGTWDFKPSLTYTGQLDNWSWGIQISGTKRLENKNSSGFAFGDLFQSTAWGGYGLTDWLHATARGIYTVQDTIKGGYIQPFYPAGPMDYTSNQGGRFWDIGLGLNAVIPGGDLQGNTLSVEWLQPIHDDFNGYQLERDGALSASWAYAF